MSFPEIQNIINKMLSLLVSASHDMSGETTDNLSVQLRKITELPTPLLIQYPMEIATAVNNLVTEFLWAANSCDPCDRESGIEHVATQIVAFTILVHSEKLKESPQVHEHAAILNAKRDVVIE